MIVNKDLERTWNTAIHHRDETLAVALDISKTFDRVWHKGTNFGTNWKLSFPPLSKSSILYSVASLNLKLQEIGVSIKDDLSKMPIGEMKIWSDFYIRKLAFYLIM